MVSLTHSALRQIVVGFGGVGLLSTEMLSAKRLPSESPAASPYLIKSSCERPLSYQLLTIAPGEVARAIDKLHALEADAIDLNMGCPAVAIGKFGGGARLMEHPDAVKEIVSEARKRTTLPLTAKIRLGAELDGEKLKAFCTMLQDEGIDMIAVHARLKHESFSRDPRWDQIAFIKGVLTIPVIANGGIFTVQDAEQCLRMSGADGLMLGRGAIARPWLFAEIAREVYGCAIPEPGVSLPAVYARFIDHLNGFRPEHRLNRLKQFTKYFSKNFAFGHYLATRVLSSASMDDARERADAFFERTGEMPVGSIVDDGEPAGLEEEGCPA
jgi:nifR3 family TIM-barrel protein